MELSKIEVREPCIYRVPSRIRDVKPEAYTPQMVVIGPLHRSPKSTAKDGAETSSNPWHLKKEYIEMEVTKKRYFESYTKRVGEDIIEEMRKTIQAEEKNIRASYEEPADWIPSEYYVELIFQDSIFIVEFFIRVMKDPDSTVNALNALIVARDLTLLENQLPYIIFDSLFSSSMKKLYGRTLHEFLIGKLFLGFFGLIIEEKTKFKHFTDIIRYVYERSLGDIPKQMKEYPWKWLPITELRNAENLSQAGVDFKLTRVCSSLEEDEAFDNYLRTVLRKARARVGDFWLHVEFEKGSLTMPGFHANEVTDMYLRNVIAFEQCHDAVIPFTTNYIHFLNFLITSNRDAQLLSEEGVVTNTMGRPSFVVDMVNKLQRGVKVGNSSQYHYVAMNLKAHYKSRRKICWATLSKVYFKDLWTGTATLAAVFLMFLTLVGTVASVIQAYKSFK